MFINEIHKSVMKYSKLSIPIQSKYNKSICKCIDGILEASRLIGYPFIPEDVAIGVDATIREQINSEQKKQIGKSF